MIKKHNWVVSIFILCIFAVFLFQRLFDFSLVEKFGLKDIRASSFRYYQFITHIFLHINLMHLIRNVFAFWVFAPRIEILLGSRVFIYFILFTGIGAAISQSLVNYISLSRIKKDCIEYEENPDPEIFENYLKYFNKKEIKSYYRFLEEFKLYSNDNEYKITSIQLVKQLYNMRLNATSIGASGIIFALLAAFALLFPNNLIYLLFFPIPIKVKYFSILYGFYELYLGYKNNQLDNVAHFAHLGGMLFGYIFIKVWKKKYLKNQ